MVDRYSNLIVGVDASRNRSGGAIAHVTGILSHTIPIEYGIKTIHLWGYKELLDAVPDRPWLIKHNPKALEKSLFHQVLWQFFCFHKEAVIAGCKVVLNTDAGSLSKFFPSITLSQDMLSYEPGEIQRYGLSLARLRLVLLRIIQNRAFRRSFGVIFLTKHAADSIQRSCGTLCRIALIPHGVGEAFRKRKAKILDYKSPNPLRLLYISNVAPYKHQWNVVKAVATLRNMGDDLRLTFVGNNSGPAQAKLNDQISESDPEKSFVIEKGHVPHDELPCYLSKADIFVFASSCENMPITLIEAMASGLPIACSNRGPMPEVLRDGGLFFDPEDTNSIAGALKMLINDPDLRMRLSKRAHALAQEYSWGRCASETWAFIVSAIDSKK